MLAAGCTPTGGGSNGSPGGQSIGDPYFPHDGNTGYQVANYKLDLSYEPGADQLRGTATISATTTQELGRFSFDFGLKTSAVTVDGTPADFTSAHDKLVVTPKSAVAADKVMTVTVTYSGAPSKVRMHGEQAWFATPDGAGSVAEPHYAAFWYPCNDHPSDKATWDVSVSVPDGTTAISNGTLVDSRQVGDRTIWKWHSDQPLATYNSMIAIGRFTTRTTTTPDGHSFFRAYSQGLSPTELKNATADIERTPEVIAWESSLFGPYPFADQGGVAIDAGHQDDAEEYQTKPEYSDVFKQDDITDVVHENAHQWFGDAVTIKSWKDIWLNEGFARYAEWLWGEHVGDKPAAQAADDDYKQYDSGDKFWKTAPGDPGADNLLDDPVYERGAMTLQALRSTVGDPTFFTILKHRVSEHKYGNDSTEEFIAMAERISRKSLKPLFNTWLFSTRRPDNPPSAGMQIR
jgi:aminopeptidase N